MSTASPVAARNRLLARLGHMERIRLADKFDSVHLSKSQVLYLAGDRITHAYFLESGMCSLLHTTAKGATIAVAMIGNEGMVGVPIILKVNKAPYQIVVQIKGEALRIRADALMDEFNRCGQLQDLTLRFAHSLLVQTVQSAACNRFCTVEERLCRWLLTSRDHARSDSLHLTHEMLSQMIGAPRSRLTTAAGVLEASGLIQYSRGNIRILKRDAMERTACECYGIVRAGIDRWIGQ